MIRRYIALAVLLLGGAFVIRTLVVAEAGNDSTLHALLVPIARVFLDTFNSSATAVSISLAMVAAGVILLLYFWVARFAPIRRDLRAVVLKLQRIPAPINRERLAQVDAIMERYNIVARSWKLFRATLSQGADGSVQAEAQPDRYFDMNVLDRVGLRMRLFMGLPNDFVGLGLIFTFLGLVAGLYFASRSMMSADLTVARDGLVMLLHAATFKFMTSIAGIGVSILLSWGQRILLGNIETELAEIRFLLEERFPQTDQPFYDTTTRSILERA
jgi:hypothetical protein